MAVVTTCSDFGAQKIKLCNCFHCFPICLTWSDGTGSLFFECSVLSQIFHVPLSLPLKGSLIPLHSLPQGWCHLHIWGYWYFSWHWFQLVLYPVWYFSWSTGAYKLNKQVNRIQPWCNPFPTRNQSVFPCPVLTAASWAAHTFLGRQVIMAWYSHLFQNFSQFVVIQTVKGFNIVNEA